jgi:hypothetical protein
MSVFDCDCVTPPSPVPPRATLLEATLQRGSGRSLRSDNADRRHRIIIIIIIIIISISISSISSSSSSSSGAKEGRTHQIEAAKVSVHSRPALPSLTIIVRQSPDERTGHVRQPIRCVRLPSNPFLEVSRCLSRACLGKIMFGF